MQIFLSYASERKTTAESIAWTLRARGHDVFFDRDDLPTGDTYDDRLQEAVERCDVFVFLISPESVTPGRWTLTELRFAQKRWRNPRHRVIPVLVAPTDKAAIPEYLKVLTILEPSGNVAAEVAEVLSSRRAWPSRRLALPVAVATLLALAAGYAFFRAPALDVDLVAGAIERKSAGLFGEPELFAVPISIRNVGRLPADVAHVTVESDPPGALVERRESEEPGKRLLSEVVFRTSPGNGEASGTGTHTYETFAYVTPARAASAINSWRVCADVQGTRRCTSQSVWRPAGAPGPTSAFPLPDEIVRNAVDVASDAAGFVVATRTPRRLYRLAPDGRIAATRDLDAEPTVLASGSLGLFVGLRPNVIGRIDPDTLTLLSTRELTAPAATTGAFDAPVSTTPASMAQTTSSLFVLTRGGASEAGLFLLDGQLSAARIPSYFSKVSFELRDITLHGDSDVVWGTQTDTTPASLFRFSENTYRQFSGHDFEAVSCALGLAVDGPTLLLPSCKGELQQIDRPDSSIMSRGVRGRLTLPSSLKDVWVTYHMVRRPDRYIVAANLITAPAGEASWSLLLQEISAGSPATLLQIENAHIASLAAEDASVVAILEAKDGRRHTVALRQSPRTQ